MNKDDFYFNIQIKKPMEFKYKNLTYNFKYDKDSNGKEYIYFGRLYEEEKYDSYGDLMNNAKIENHLLKNMLDTLDL